MSRRGTLPELRSPHPLGLMLPGLYHGDPFAQGFTEGLDAVLAPVLSTLDCLDAYLDPRLAPADFVEWLAGWVGLAVDENWPLDRQRALVARTVELYSWRGTARGLVELVRLYVGVEPEVTDSGGAAWSAVPGGEAPGSAEPVVRVRVRVPAGEEPDARRLDAVVAAAKPAHVRHEVEVEIG